MVRCFKLKTSCFYVHVVVAVFCLVLGLSTNRCWAQAPEGADPPQGRLVHTAATSRADDPFDDISFPTFYKSGFDVCTNGAGKPVILLFSSSSCSHCQWVGEIFDTIIPLYLEEGLIEAHHYDKPTGDDLLTEEIETEIPEEMLDIYKRGNPKKLLPYLNFSCKYERIGTGYEKTQDIEAEAREMLEIIEMLLQYGPSSGEDE